MPNPEPHLFSKQTASGHIKNLREPLVLRSSASNRPTAPVIRLECGNVTGGYLTQF